MRNSTALAVEVTGMGLSTAITAVWALGIVPPAVWIVLLIFGLFLMLVVGPLIWRRGEPPAGDSPLDRLRGALARGITLQNYVLMEGAAAYENAEGEVVGDQYEITRDEPLLKWARETWGVLHAHFPEYANEFYGEEYKLGSAHFTTAFSEEVQRDGRDSYLDQRIALLERIIDRFSPPKT
jgi:hypothetical protein